MAASAAVLGGIARLPLSPRSSSSPSSSSSALLLLPPRPSGVNLLTRSSFSHRLQGPPRFSSLRIRASSSEESSVEVNELFTDLKEMWDGLENKSTVLIYGGGAVVAVWLSSIIVGAINSVPLLPKLMELVGLGYTGWFVYRYLLFKSSRKELVSDIEELKKKIAGTGE